MHLVDLPPDLALQAVELQAILVQRVGPGQRVVGDAPGEPMDQRPAQRVGMQEDVACRVDEGARQGQGRAVAEVAGRRSSSRRVEQSPALAAASVRHRRAKPPAPAPRPAPQRSHGTREAGPVDDRVEPDRGDMATVELQALEHASRRFRQRSPRTAGSVPGDGRDHAQHLRLRATQRGGVHQRLRAMLDDAQAGGRAARPGSGTDWTTTSTSRLLHGYSRTHTMTNANISDSNITTATATHPLSTAAPHAKSSACAASRSRATAPASARWRTLRAQGRAVAFLGQVVGQGHERQHLRDGHAQAVEVGAAHAARRGAPAAGVRPSARRGRARAAGARAAPR